MKPLLSPAGRRASAVIFMSGSGTNAERILEHQRDLGERCPFSISALVTDCPQTSRARAIAAIWGLPVVEHPLRSFYRQHGLESTSLATPEGRRVRELWSAELMKRLQPLAPDFGIFAGFVPLSNITASLSCLNVHPGDLTVTDGNGARILTGLHTVPIERAILDAHHDLASTVIVASPYSGEGAGMDDGIILGLSPRVAVDLQGYSLAELQACADARPPQRPAQGYGDLLERVAGHNQERLKRGGDWLVFARCVGDFAAGIFGTATDGGLALHMGGRWHPVSHVEYGQSREVIFRDGLG